VRRYAVAAARELMTNANDAGGEVDVTPAEVSIGTWRVWPLDLHRGNGVLSCCMQHAERNTVNALQFLEPPVTRERQVYDAVRQALRDKFAPGDSLSAPALARQLGVSRTPVTQALQRLLAEGFLTMEPRKGVRVANPNAAAIRERYLMLIALETLCASEAFARAPAALAAEMRAHLAEFGLAKSGADEGEIDHDFHSVLWNQSGLPNVAAQLELLWERGAYYRTVLAQAVEHRERRSAEHEAIVLAAQENRFDGFVDALRQHRLAGMERMQHLIAGSRDRP
jgi:DNA-binding GntR family transcriptional regulator